MKRQRGFTLMELLISVSIIAILIAIGIASYTTVNRQSRDTKRKSDIEQIRSALEMYRADNGYYPDAGGGSWTDIMSPTDDQVGLTPYLVSTYIPLVPNDIKESETYLYVATNGSGGQYYGYCISAKLESEDPQDSCSPYSNHNYGTKNP